APTLRASRTDEGFLLNFAFAHPPDEVQIKLPDDTGFRSIGDRTWIVLPASSARAKLQIKYRKVDGWAGPFALVFDPDEIVLREAREALDALPAWVEVQEAKKGKLQVSFAFLRRFDKAIRLVQYAFDEDVPSRPLPDGESRRDAPPGAKY